jgi:hypothetical protein
MAARRRGALEAKNGRCVVSRIEALEKEIEKLSRSELADFRDWFLEFDAEAWDRQIETDAAEGRLDRFAEVAIVAHE